MYRVQGLEMWKLEARRSLYRGLIFGDGAGLDNMGFAIEGLTGWEA